MRGKWKRLRCMLLMVVFLLLSLRMTTYADSKRKGWVRENNKCYYYVHKKPVKGLKKIGGRSYYFDKHGVQKVSWRKIGKNYYCFHSGECAEGYMLTDVMRNGIRIGQDGKAVETTKRGIRKLKLMVRYSALMDKIILKNKHRLKSRQKKLKACFTYLREHYPYRFVSHFRKKDKNYDLWFAEALLKRSYSDCHPLAFGFAYLANAVGCGKIVVLSWISRNSPASSHSYTAINGKRYDVLFNVFKGKLRQPGSIRMKVETIVTD